MPRKPRTSGHDAVKDAYQVNSMTCVNIVLSILYLDGLHVSVVFRYDKSVTWDPKS